MEAYGLPGRFVKRFLRLAVIGRPFLSVISSDSGAVIATFLPPLGTTLSVPIPGMAMSAVRLTVRAIQGLLCPESLVSKHHRC